MAAGLGPAEVADLFAAFGRVSVRRMFGCAGVFAEGLMIAIINDGLIFLKTDAAGREAFAREGCAPFSYAKKDGTHQLTSYWRLPERLYDNPDELAAWARAALAVAQAKQAEKRPLKTVARARKR